MEAIGKRITVAMISMNEERAVAKVIGDIRNLLPDAEIVVVDSSSDHTAEIAQSLGARVIRQFPPRGYGPAMDTALRSSGREVIVTLDCDDTYPVEFIEPMARIVLEDGYDLVDGSRLAGKPAAMPWINFFANWGFALLASLAFLHRIRDLHSGMRAYRKSLIDRIDYDMHGAACGRVAIAADSRGLPGQSRHDSLSSEDRRKYDAPAAKRMVDTEADLPQPFCLIDRTPIDDGPTSQK